MPPTVMTNTTPTPTLPPQSQSQPTHPKSPRKHHNPWHVHLTHSSLTLAQKLITKLARGLYASGAPLYTVELRVQDVAQAIGLPLTVLALPSGLVLAYGSGDDLYHWPATYLVPGVQGTNMGKLYAIDRLAKVMAGSTADREVVKKVRARVLKSMGVTEDEAKKKEQEDEEVQLGSNVIKRRSKYAPLDASEHELATIAHPSPPPFMSSSQSKQGPSLDPTSSPSPSESASDSDSETDPNTPSLPTPAALMGIRRAPKSLIQTLALSPMQLQAYMDELDAILSSPDTFPRWLTVFCQGTTGMLLAALWIPVTPLDLLFTFLMGIVHGLMLVAEQQYKIMAMDVGIPLVVGALARALELGLGRDKVCFATMAVMSSFSYFPGVPITLAMVEFAAYNTMTGVVRLLDAFLRIFKLGFGMVMGAAITSAIALGQSGMGDTTCMSTRRPGSVVVKTMYPVIPLVAIPLVCGMNVVLKAQYRQFGWMVLVGGSSLATYLIALINDLDPGIAASICALVASLLSQLLANRFNHVGIATLIAGLIWLNPGPPFIRGAMLMLSQDIQSSVVFATEAVVRALSIILGLYVSRLLMTPVLRAGRGGGSRLADLSA